MRKTRFSFFLLATFILSLNATAQVSHDNSDRYRNYPAKKMPKGTQLRFETEIIIPADQKSVRVNLKSVKNCELHIDSTLTKEYDQVIAAGTAQPVAESDSWGVRLSLNPNIYIYCPDVSFGTVGEIIDAFSGPLLFEFPEPIKPQPFIFPKPN